MHRSALARLAAVTAAAAAAVGTTGCAACASRVVFGLNMHHYRRPGGVSGPSAPSRATKEQRRRLRQSAIDERSSHLCSPPTSQLEPPRQTNGGAGRVAHVKRYTLEGQAKTDRHSKGDTLFKTHVEFLPRLNSNLRNSYPPPSRSGAHRQKPQPSTDRRHERSPSHGATKAPTHAKKICVKTYDAKRKHTQRIRPHAPALRCATPPAHSARPPRCRRPRLGSPAFRRLPCP